MIDGSNFKSAGTELNRMMDNLGFPDRVGDLYGAALDAAVGNNSGVARNLLDAYSPLSTAQFDQLTKSMSAAAFMPRPGTYFPSNPALAPGYAGANLAAFPTPAQMQQIVNSFLNRMAPQNLASAVSQLNNGAPLSPNQSLPEALGKTFEQILAQLEGKIERKMDAEAAAPAAGKKRKKKGGLSKMKKSLTKKFKSATKFAKKTFKSAFKTVSQSLTSFLKALPKGNIFELGRALTGGLIGGPVGGLLLNEVMKLGGKKNPLQQVFKQVHNTFDLVGNLHRNQADLQRALVSKFLR
ncbi:hypothetical protein L0222_04170 [bacterium]|nr:hypothetical protein [bacterium]